LLYLIHDVDLHHPQILPQLVIQGRHQLKRHIARQLRRMWV
jgi:hypothetical protein